MKNIVRIIEQGTLTSSKFEESINDFLAKELGQWEIKSIWYTSDAQGKQTCSIWLKAK